MPFCLIILDEGYQHTFASKQEIVTLHLEGINGLKRLVCRASPCLMHVLALLGVELGGDVRCVLVNELQLSVEKSYSASYFNQLACSGIVAAA